MKPLPLDESGSQGGSPRDRDGRKKEVPTESLQKGDIFLVKPGSLVPVDGIVLEGNSSVDEAAITG